MVPLNVGYESVLLDFNRGVILAECDSALRHKIPPLFSRPAPDLYSIKLVYSVKIPLLRTGRIHFIGSGEDFSLQKR